MLDWPFKRCSGAHCLKRDECAHHALPTHLRSDELAHPMLTGERCKWFLHKHEGWGEGKDGDE